LQKIKEEATNISDAITLVALSQFENYRLLSGVIFIGVQTLPCLVVGGSERLSGTVAKFCCLPPLGPVS
jgi:hypothetical protein